MLLHQNQFWCFLLFFFGSPFLWWQWTQSSSINKLQFWNIFIAITLSHIEWSLFHQSIIFACLQSLIKFIKSFPLHTHSCSWDLIWIYLYSFRHRCAMKVNIFVTKSSWVLLSGLCAHKAHAHRHSLRLETLSFSKGRVN